MARLLFLDQDPRERPAPGRAKGTKKPARDLAVRLQGQLAEKGLALEYDVAVLAGRRYRFDLVHRAARLVVDVQGAEFGRPVYCNTCGQPVTRAVTGRDGVTRVTPVREAGHHSHGYGMADDCEKHNLAVLDGWRVLLFTGAQVKDGTACKVVLQALGGGAWTPPKSTPARPRTRSPRRPTPTEASS